MPWQTVTATEEFVRFDRSNFTVTSTTVLPNSSAPLVSVTRNGLQVSQQSAADLVTTYAYDSLRRLICTSDPRIDGSTLAQNLGLRIGYYDGTASVGERYQKEWTKDTAGNQTTYSYSSTTGRLSAVQNPPQANQSGKYTYYDYSHRGELVRQWGQVTYPVEYAYDDYGEKVAMRTFRDTSTDFTAAWPLSDDADPANPDPTAWTSGDKTTWTFDPATGLLQNKTDATGKAVSYTYTELGQVKTKTWARGVSITYQYYGDAAGDLLTGELKSKDYSDTTSTNPDVSYSYDRMGHTASVMDATGTRTFHYDPASTALQTETLPAFFGSRVLTQKYDTTNTGTLGRGTGFTLGVSGGATDYDVTYGYDTYGRGYSVAAGGATFTYGYQPGSNLIHTITDSVSGWTQTRTWMSNRDLLASIETQVGATNEAEFAYGCDEWGRRTSVVRTGEVYSRYINQGLVTTWGYDDRSQVTAAKTYYGQSLSDLSYPVEGRNFGFTFDNIGNRLTSSVDGRSTSYNSNALNQITDRGTPGSVDVSGFAPTGSTVQANGQAVNRQGDYYHTTLTVDNSAKAVNEDVSVTSTSPSATVARKRFVAKAALGSTEKWQYDADGNLTQDDEWTYSWDADNRLISMETRPDLISTGVIAAADALRVEFTYDYLGRRAEKIVRTGWNGTSYATLQSDTRFIYHGWNLVAELNYDAGTSAFVLGRSYTWGVDLSGTLAGDGGTGGLLMTQDGTAQYVYAYDGNGNVSAVMNRADGTTVAEYEYGAFGETMRASGTYAQTNPYRFATQYVDNETGLSYYGHRYYSPETGRFLGRDTTEEAGGANLYAFCANGPVNRFDLLGNGYISGAYYSSDVPTSQQRIIDAIISGQNLGLGATPFLVMQAENENIASSLAQSSHDQDVVNLMAQQQASYSAATASDANQLPSVSQVAGEFQQTAKAASAAAAALPGSVALPSAESPGGADSGGGSAAATDANVTFDSGSTGGLLTTNIASNVSYDVAAGNSTGAAAESGAATMTANGATATPSTQAPSPIESVGILSGGASSGAVSTASLSAPLTLEPSESTYGTFALGLNQSGTAGISVGQTTGLVVDSHGNLAVFQTYSGGAGAGADGSPMGVFLGVSNAQDIDSYKKESVDASVAAGLVANGTVDLSFANDGGGADGTDRFVELGATIAAGGGASAQVTVSYTRVTPIGNLSDIPWWIGFGPL